MMMDLIPRHHDIEQKYQHLKVSIENSPMH